MTIEEAAAKVGMPVETVRSLAERGLVTPDAAGAYDEWRLAQLAVAKRGLDLGVPEPEIVGLLTFFANEAASTAALQEAVAAQTAEFQAKLDELEATKRRLESLPGAA